MVFFWTQNPTQSVIHSAIGEQMKLNLIFMEEIWSFFVRFDNFLESMLCTH